MVCIINSAMRTYGLNGRSYCKIHHRAISLVGIPFLDRGRDFDVYRENSYTRLFGQPCRRAEDISVCPAERALGVGYSRSSCAHCDANPLLSRRCHRRSARQFGARAFFRAHDVSRYADCTRRSVRTHGGAQRGGRQCFYHRGLHRVLRADREGPAAPCYGAGCGPDDQSRSPDVRRQSG